MLRQRRRSGAEVARAFRGGRERNAVLSYRYEADKKDVWRFIEECNAKVNVIERA